MKNRAIVSERGTITIPEPIRRRTHIHAGDIVEFESKGNWIVLRHLVVKHPEAEFLNSSGWEQFDRLVQAQIQKGEYTRYDNLKKAKEHSRKLFSKE